MSNGQDAEGTPFANPSGPQSPHQSPYEPYEWTQPQQAQPFGPRQTPAGHPHRRRGAVVGSVAAVVAVGALVAATRAGGGSPISLVSHSASSAGSSSSTDPSGSSGSSTSYLTTNKKTVASSVSGAIVDIVSTEKYEQATAAGTGLVLTSTGEILTNNHVIDGATSIKVTVTSTGRSYLANVVGTDATDDIAVIQLVNASGLKTVPIGDSDKVKVGDKVTAQGNAGGRGGTPSKVTGKVTALAQSITASDEGSNAEQLSGLIETDAPIVAGDSGGPLSADGTVIGIDTAASASNGQTQFGGQGFGQSSSGSSTSADQGYAIPIKTALTIAHKISTGQASSTIEIGLHGFLGIELATADTSTGASGFGGYSRGGFGGGFYGDSGGSSDPSTTSGAVISGVVTGGAADAAGLSAGEVITTLNGTTVDSATTLNTLMTKTKPGQKVSVTYTDTSGQAQTATLTLGTAAAA